MMRYLHILGLFSCCYICAVRSQQQFGVAVGNNGDGNAGNIIRKEFYEYNAPGAHMNRRRQAGPFDGVLPGLVLTIASSAVQWWNEGRAVRDAKMLADAKRQVVELDSTSSINPENDGKLVHITGNIKTQDGLIDPVHGLHRQDALQLTRTTEAYQWKEQRSESKTRVSERETRVNVEYRYHKAWARSPIESSRFESPGGHYNPSPQYQLGRRKMTASDAKLSNGFHISPDLINQISDKDTMMHFASPTLAQTNEGHCKSPVMLGSGEDLPYNGDAVISSNTLYFSSNTLTLENNDPGNNGLIGSPGSQGTKKRMSVVRSIPQPGVGDVRVSWSEVIAPRNGVSILAKQRDDTLVPWTHGDQGHNIYSLFVGEFTAESMIKAYIGKNKFVTRLLRFGGWVGSFIGMNMLLSCIPAFVKMVPFGIGNILEPLAYIASSTIAIGVSFGLSAAVISMAWLRFRPLLAIGFAFASGAGFLGPLFYARSKRSPEVKVMDAELQSGDYAK